MGTSFEIHFQIHIIDNSWNKGSHSQRYIIICIKQLKKFVGGSGRDDVIFCSEGGSKKSRRTMTEGREGGKNWRFLHLWTAPNRKSVNPWLGAKLRCSDWYFCIVFESDTFLALKSTYIIQIELQSTSLRLFISKISWCLEYRIVLLLG